MADAPQNFSNHTRLDPPFHFFILPVFAISLIATIVHLVRRPSVHSAWLVVFMIAAIAAIFKDGALANDFPGEFFAFNHGFYLPG